MKSGQNCICLYIRIYLIVIFQKKDFYSILLLLSRVFLGFFATKQTWKKIGWPIRAKALTLTQVTQNKFQFNKT